MFALFQQQHYYIFHVSASRKISSILQLYFRLLQHFKPVCAPADGEHSIKNNFSSVDWIVKSTSSVPNRKDIERDLCYTPRQSALSGTTTALCCYDDHGHPANYS